MDVLISSFVKEVINSIDKKQLIQLDELVNLDDETLSKINGGSNKILNNKNNEIIKLFQNLKYNSGGRTGIRTQEKSCLLPVFKTGAFNHSAILP